MKTLKVNNNFFKYIKSNSGMAVLEFIITMCFIFILLAAFIEIGYLLKSEVVVMMVTKQAAREINSIGCLNDNIRDGIIGKLQKSNLTVTKILFEVEGRTPREMPLTGSLKEIVLFRQDFGLVVWANHSTKTISFGKYGRMPIPLGFQQGGRGEVWTTNSLTDTY